MKSLISSFLLLILFASCGNSSEELNNTQEVVRDTTAVYGNSKFKLPKLSKVASEIVADWPIFEDFQNEAATINGKTLKELQVKVPRLLAHTDSLSKKIPDSLNTRPIASRLIIVKTRAQLLDQILKQSKFDSLALETALNELNLSTEHFILQLNGKLQKDAIDFQRREDEEKELEKQKKYLDSIFQSEINDNKEN